LLEQGD